MDRQHQPPPTLGNGYGVYRYTTYFDLTGFDPNSASITGRVVGDDGVYAVYLNDVQEESWQFLNTVVTSDQGMAELPEDEAGNFLQRYYRVVY